MKNKLLLILTILFIPTFVSASEHNYLYDVLKNEKENGTLVKEYTGEHNDTIGGGNKKIYHWYSTNSTETSQIQNKWNVVFGGYCWEMFRTTDGGGTKIIYNGKAINNKCTDDREIEGHYYGYNESCSEIGTNYYYGTSFRYDENTNKYYLDGEITRHNYTDKTDKSFLRLYTCKQENQDGCDKIYYAIRYNGNSCNRSGVSYPYISYLTITRSAQSNYNQKYYFVGTTPYTYNKDYINTIGYMYSNDYYSQNRNINYGKYEVNTNNLTQDKYNVISNNSDYPYTYETSYNRWKVTTQNAKTSTMKFKLSQTGNLIFKYTYNCNYVDMYLYRNNELVKKIERNIAIYNNYVVLLNNVTADDEFEIKYKASYGNDSVTMYFTIGVPTGEVVDNRLIFGNSVEYSNGKYKLIDTIRNDGTEKTTSYHYTCFDTTDECEMVYYTLYTSDSNAEYTELTGGKKIEDIVSESYKKDDMNENNSIIKEIVDRWFKNNLINNKKYLEPTTFCNNRKIYNEDILIFNPNGGNSYPRHLGEMYQNYHYNNNELFSNLMYCPNETDRFSVNNPKAKLEYSVGLLTVSELDLLQPYESNFNVFKKDAEYYTMTPSSSSVRVYMTAVSSTRGFNNLAASGYMGARPVISLKNNVEYESGTGSKEDPYIVADLMYSNILTENDDAKGTLNIVGDTEDIRNDTLVKFTVEKKKGFNVNTVKVYDDVNNEIELTKTGNTYKFNMPTSDVRVVVTYNPVINIINTLKNMNTALIAIILVIIGYATYLLIINRKKSK